MNNYLPYFFGPQADYYTGVAEDLDEGKVRFNEGAFFFGMFWMAYRKMYANAAITFVILMAESGLEDWLIPELSQSRGYWVGSNLLVGSLLGFIGNRLYINFARKRVAKLTALPNQADSAPDRDTITRLRRAGGTSWVGLLVVLVAYIALVAYAFYLAMEPDSI